VHGIKCEMLLFLWRTSSFRYVREVYKVQLWPKAFPFEVMQRIEVIYSFMDILATTGIAPQNLIFLKLIPSPRAACQNNITMRIIQSSKWIFFIANIIVTETEWNLFCCKFPITRTVSKKFGLQFHICKID